ncbi:MAG: hypothetical protein ACREAA_11500 [Candidatus Polarisedimenticolia bacterium]
MPLTPRYAFPLVASLAALILGPLASSTTLEQPAQLSATPGGPPVALLMAGTTLTVIETKEGWSHVTLEGWIPATPSTSVQEAPEAPAPEQAGTGSVGGIVFVTDKGGATHPGARIAIRLLAAPPESLVGLTDVRSECAARRERLVARAAELKDQAGRALRTIESTSQAFQASDAAKAERRRVLAEVEALDKDCQEQEDKILQSHAVQNTITDGDGRYGFEAVAPGSYLVQATLDAAKERHEWLVELRATAGSRLTLDLTPGNRASVRKTDQAR